MQLAEDMLVYVVADVLKRRKPSSPRWSATCRSWKRSSPRSRASATTRSKILSDHPEPTFKYGDDFGAPDETILSNLHDRPMVHRYPSEVKAFYMAKRDPKDAMKRPVRRRDRAGGRGGRSSAGASARTT
jgi:asparaginyl-tRNA synthetase